MDSKKTSFSNGRMPNEKIGYVQYMENEHEQLVICGYTSCWKRAIFMWTGVVLTFGLLLLLFHWQPRWRLLCTHTRCSLANAQKLVILETYQSKCKTYHIKDIKITTAHDVQQPQFNYQYENQDNGSSKDSFLLYFDDGSRKVVNSYRSFKSKKISFVWDENKNCFLRMVGLEKNTTCVEFHSIHGYSAEQQATMRKAYGENEIQVPVQSILTLFLLEFFNPFYMFQLFTIAVWLAENYYYYCIAIVIMSVFGITTSIIQTRKNQINLKSTVQSVGDVQVCRDKSAGTFEHICSSQLVPGDIILIPSQGCTMHVDAILLDGSCIVNESMLTGESVPITKTALPCHNRTFSIKDDANHILHCGTKVIQTRYYKNEPVKAVVLRTGFLTTKGQLVRSIMYPLPADFKFDRDSYKFIIILTVLAFLGLIYTVILKSGREITAGDIIIKSLDIITIVVPPALPAAMTVGRLYAISRLKKAQVYCINPRVINVCGSTSCVCFDKTGTLTEDGLDMWGIVPVKLLKSVKDERSLLPKKKTVSDTELVDVTQFINENDSYSLSDSDAKSDSGETVAFGTPITDPSTLDDDDLLKIGMNVCHSLTVLDDQITGDPLDVKMFESTGWILEEPKVPDNTKFDLLVPTVVRPSNDDSALGHEWGIIQQYQFSSSLQRSSVVCKALQSKQYTVFCKGSPEMIAALSVPDSVPPHMKTSLRYYTQQGYRVLALAYRHLQEESFIRIQRLTRDQVEMDLIFLGLIILENRLKPESAAVIQELHEADIKVVMITGDNLDTAVSVASECGLLRKGDRLILCETSQTSEDSLPDLYYTSSLINVEGLKKSKTNSENVPSITRISTNTISDLNIRDSSTSTLSIDSLENGANKKYKIAMTGATWKVLKEHYQNLIPKLITRGAVFARMSSDQKQQLVQDLQALGYYVAMCGDGANDCGALKTAHVGISVSGQESSVASPFTSKDEHVGCVPLVIREGRAALVTSFGMFKFMVAYSLVEFISVAILYYFDSNLTDFQFLYVDIVLILTFAFFFGKTHAYPGKLHKAPPSTSLLGFVALFSISVQILLAVIFQSSSYVILCHYSWYEPHTFQGDIEYLSYENYAVFCVSMFQYITLSITFSQGKPYRKSILSNYVFLLCIFLTTALSVYVVIYPATWLENLLELKMPPDFHFRYVILGLAALNFVGSLFIEKIIVQYFMQEKEMIPRRLRGNFPKSNSYQNIEKELEKDDNWPPVSNGQMYKFSGVNEKTKSDNK
ncbi:polyamine-transporting ATPase anne boleyn isoform X2 [Arctopsyche grandis]|uniref:polyamine-transporting ATPase anne boleyn isoform X2 n=1 Tax=Arctopsyche grandis TaxID=121162 RepID=UPI00406DA350